jgi:hypothetical protein
MRCQNDDSILTVLANDIPSKSAREWIHPRRWLIEHDDFAAAAKSNLLKVAL